MNRADPWDWSSPFKLDQSMQALSAQVVPLGNQGNTQAPPPVAPYSSPFQQAMTNRAMNTGFNKLDGKPEVPHDPAAVPVEDAVPKPVEQVGAPLATGDTVTAINGGQAAADAQALYEAQLAAQGVETGGLLSSLGSFAVAA